VEPTEGTQQVFSIAHLLMDRNSAECMEATLITWLPPKLLLVLERRASGRGCVGVGLRWHTSSSCAWAEHASGRTTLELWCNKAAYGVGSKTPPLSL